MSKNNEMFEFTYTNREFTQIDSGIDQYEYFIPNDHCMQCSMFDCLSGIHEPPDSQDGNSYIDDPSYEKLTLQDIIRFVNSDTNGKYHRGYMLHEPFYYNANLLNMKVFYAGWHIATAKCVRIDSSRYGKHTESYETGYRYYVYEIEMHTIHETFDRFKPYFTFVKRKNQVVWTRNE